MRTGIRLRRVILVCLSAAMSVGAASRADKAEAPFRVALSVSPFAEGMIAAGYVFWDGRGNQAKSVTELQRLFMAHGANEMFVRIATDRFRPKWNITDHSLETAKKLAALAVELGLPLNPEIMLVQHYGDVTGQPGPDFSEYPELGAVGPWEDLTIEEMEGVIERYAALVAGEIAVTGARVNIWDIGNEVNFGIAGIAPKPLPGAMAGELGPGWYRAPNRVDPALGQQSVYTLLVAGGAYAIDWCRKHVWPYQARLMQAVKRGVLSVDPGARFSTHITLASQTELAVAFFRAMREGGYTVDEIGFSFYPSASAEPDRLERFRATVRAVRAEFGLPVFIAEYAYPAEPIETGPFKGWNNQAGGYGLTPAGQAAILRDLVSWGAKNGVRGIRPWAPELVIPVWGAFSLFALADGVAKARPALDAIAEGLSGR